MPLPIFALINVSFLASLFFAFPIMFFAGRNNFIALVKLMVLAKERPRQPKDTRMDD